MEIRKPSFQIMAITGHPELPYQYDFRPEILIETAGRNCYKSEKTITGDSAKFFVATIQKNRHLTVLEHSWEGRLYSDLGRSTIRAGNWSKYLYFSDYNPIVTGNARAWMEIEGGNCLPSNYTVLPGEELRRFALQNNEPFLMRATIRLINDRGVSHELVRHRPPVFSQESTRYVNYLKRQIQFLLPPWVDPENFNLFSWFSKKKRADLIWLIACKGSELLYGALIKLGWTAQQARSVLINSLKTELVMSATIQEFQHFFRQRALSLTGTPHPQMLEIAKPLLEEFRKHEPFFFSEKELRKPYENGD